MPEQMNQQTTRSASSVDPAVDDFKARVASAAEAQKNRAAESLGGIADAARETSDRLRGENEWIAALVNTAGDQLRDLAERLRERHPSEVADALSRFGRERPAVFLGGAFLIGLAIGRLMKSSPMSADMRSDRYQGYPDGEQYSFAQPNEPMQSGGGRSQRFDESRPVGRPADEPPDWTPSYTA